jgi:hypothetical protein
MPLNSCQPPWEVHTVRSSSGLRALPQNHCPRAVFRTRAPTGPGGRTAGRWRASGAERQRHGRWNCRRRQTPARCRGFRASWRPARRRPRERSARAGRYAAGHPVRPSACRRGGRVRRHWPRSRRPAGWRFPAAWTVRHRRRWGGGSTAIKGRLRGEPASGCAGSALLSRLRASRGARSTAPGGGP